MTPRVPTGRPRGVTDEQLTWLATHDTGVSSKTLWCVMTRTDFRLVLGLFGPSAPLDPGDFGRCHRLLDRFPRWRRRIAETRPWFGALVDHWAEIETLYEEELAAGNGTRETWTLMCRAMNEPDPPRKGGRVTMCVRGRSAAAEGRPR